MFLRSAQFPGDSLIIAGDFNADPFRTNRGPRFDNAFRNFRASKTRDGFDCFPYLRVHTFIGHQGASCIDHLLSYGLQVLDKRVELAGTVPHRPVVGKFVVQSPQLSTAGLEPKAARWALPNNPICNFSELIHQGFTSLLRSLPTPATVEQLYSVLFSALTTYCKPCNHSTGGPRKADGWYRLLLPKELDDLEILRGNLTKALMDLDRDNSAKSRKEVLSTRQQLIDSKSNLRKTALVRLANSQEVCFAAQQSMWKLLRRLRQAPTVLPIQPAALYDHFRRVLYRPNLSLMLGYDLRHHGPFFDMDEQLDIPFGLDELELALQNSNKLSAPGPDGFSISIILALFSDATTKNWLLFFMNQCFSQGTVPADWGNSEIFVLFKGKGHTSDPDNYRGITLLNALFKIYERLLFQRLNNWAEQRGLLGSNQFGFRSGRSTLDAVFSVLALIDKYVFYQRQPLHAVLVDIRKAFPSVPRAQLVQHLSYLGVPTRMKNAVCSILSWNKGKVRIGDVVTESFPINVGVREGGVLSPLLFVLYYASVLFHVDQHCFTHPPCNPTLERGANAATIGGLLYADDLIVFGLSRAEVQERLNRASLVLGELGLSINTAKTELITFIPSRYSTVVIQNFQPILSDGKRISEVDSVKYLGFTFHRNGRVSAHVDTCLAKAKAAGLELSRLLHKLRASSFRTISQLYVSLVQSQFYGVALMNPKEATRAMRLSNIFFFNHFVGLPKSVAHAFYPAMNLFPEPMSVILRARVRFIERICLLDEECAALQALRYMRWSDLPRPKEFFGFLISSFAKHTNIPWYRMQFSDLLNTFAAAIANEVKDDNILEVASKPTLELVADLFSGSFPHEIWSVFNIIGISAVRPFLAILSGSARWSCFGQERRVCPLCSSSLYGRHFFLCAGIVGEIARNGVTIEVLQKHVHEGNWVEVVRGILRLYFIWFEKIGTGEPSDGLRELRLELGL